MYTRHDAPPRPPASGLLSTACHTDLLGLNDKAHYIMIEEAHKGAGQSAKAADEKTAVWELLVGAPSASAMRLVHDTWRFAEDRMDDTACCVSASGRDEI